MRLRGRAPMLGACFPAGRRKNGRREQGALELWAVRASTGWRNAVLAGRVRHRHAAGRAAAIAETAGRSGAPLNLLRRTPRREPPVTARCNSIPPRGLERAHHRKDFPGCEGTHERGPRQPACLRRDEHVCSSLSDYSRRRSREIARPHFAQWTPASCLAGGSCDLARQRES